MRKKTILIVVIPIMLAALAFGGWVLYRRSVYNPAASCANCRSFIWHYFEEYAQQHDGWYPSGGTNPLDSLSQCVKEARDVHLFTSHAQHGLTAYWEEHSTFSADLCCYRYNEGLGGDDPAGLILMYYFKPTLWECKSHRKKELGRPVSFVPPGHSWDWLPEAEFQAKQKKTIEYIQERQLRAADLATIASLLKLVVHSTPTDSNRFRITAELRNEGPEPMHIQFIHHGSLQGFDLLDSFKDKPELALAPEESFAFPGWCDVVIADTIRDGKIVSRGYSRKGLHSRHSSTSSLGSPQEPEEMNAREIIKASIRVEVETETIHTIQLLIRSKDIQYMKHTKTDAGDDL